MASQHCTSEGLLCDKNTESVNQIRRPPCGATRLLKSSLQSCSLVSPSPSVSTVLQSCCPSPAICCTAGPGAQNPHFTFQFGRCLNPGTPPSPASQRSNIAVYSQHPPGPRKCGPRHPKSHQNEVPGHPDHPKISKKLKVGNFKKTSVFTMFSTHLTIIFRQNIHPPNHSKNSLPPQAAGLVPKITKKYQTISKIGSREVAKIHPTI